MPLDFGANRLTDTQSVKTKQLREIREKNEQLAEVKQTHKDVLAKACWRPDKRCLSYTDGHCSDEWPC